MNARSTTLHPHYSAAGLEAIGLMLALRPVGTPAEEVLPDLDEMDEERKAA